MVNNLWEHERHHLQTAARQRLLDKSAAYEHQEAARRQRLLDEETAHHQCLLDKEATRCCMAKCTALAQWMVADRTIFLWLCCCHLHIRLVRQTLQQQQLEAALAHLQYEQDCCLRAALVEKQHRQAAAARAKALADKATEQHCHEAAAREKALANKANKQRRQESAKHAAALAESVSAAEQRCSLFAAPLKMATNLAIEKALAELAKFAASWTAMLAEIALTVEQRSHEAAAQEKALANDEESQRCRESAARAGALVALVSAVEQSCQESADCPAVSAEMTLANKRHCQKEVECSAMLGETVLAVERLCSLLATRAAELALATAQVAVLADSLLPKPALAKDEQRQEETAEKQCHADEERVMAPVLPTDPGNAAIRRIQVECALLTAPLDAILAKIERDDIAHKARAPPTTTLPHPVAMLFTPPPYDLHGYGLFYDGVEHLCDVPCSGTIGYTIAYR